HRDLHPLPTRRSSDLKMLTITELFLMMKKYVLPAAAAAFLGAVATYLGVLLVRDYICTLTFQYNYEGAEENLAPDGAGTLDPYQDRKSTRLNSSHVSI